jgi:Mg2+/Co2+ transporter CorB
MEAVVTLEDIIERLMGYHANSSASADAMDYIEASKYHDKVEKAIQETPLNSCFSKDELLRINGVLQQIKLDEP